jgi:hypothetical protein
MSLHATLLLLLEIVILSEILDAQFVFHALGQAGCSAFEAFDSCVRWSGVRQRSLLRLFVWHFRHFADVFRFWPKILNCIKTELMTEKMVKLTSRSIF